jgi:hypothetical protein
MKCLIVLSALIAIGVCAPAPQHHGGHGGHHGHGRRVARQLGVLSFPLGLILNPYRDPYYGGDYINFTVKIRISNLSMITSSQLVSLANFHWKTD